MSRKKIFDLFKDCHAISTDTRKLDAGSIFFALKGANFDGNSFAQKALDSGCIAAVIDDKDLQYAAGFILVEDVLTSLQELAIDYRYTFNIPFLGITGSNGKTTTKELIRDVLGKKFRVHATKGNFNNHIGVPLTLLSMPVDTEFAIIEMGANHVGEIRDLSAIASPDFGLVTNIGRAHLEGFGGIDGVIKGKGELFEFIKSHEGLAFVNTELAHLTEMADGMRTFAYQTTGDSMFKQINTDQGLLDVEWKGQNIQTQLSGAYNAHNLAAAIAVGTFFEIPDGDIVSALRSYVPDNQRSQLTKTKFNTVILDAYNANPTSMIAALENLAAAGPSAFYIIGDMFELGEFSGEEHKRVLETAGRLKLKGMTVGEQFGGLLHPDSSRHFNSKEALIAHLTKDPLKGKTILLKGSRGMRLEELLECL